MPEGTIEAILSGSAAWAIVCGDAREVLPTLPESGVDLVATDPPYGWHFMGKEFDRNLADPAVWRECLRVLKPGGSAVVMSGARLDCLWRMCRDVEEAGFELSQTAFFWCYRSGFPKGGDLSKMADQRAGAEREVLREAAYSANRTETTFHGAEYKGGYTTQAEGLRHITAPTTDLARELDGWFTKGKVKPAVEVIIWARKPTSEKTELTNMERWGVGAVNCGECMVPFEEGEGWNYPQGQGGVSGYHLHSKQFRVDQPIQANPAGRFPANLLCTGDQPLGESTKYFDLEAWAREHGYSEDWAAAAEAGVLQVAKASRAEKNAGLESVSAGTTYNRKCTRCGKWERAQGIDPVRYTCTCEGPEWIEPRGANHPTIKPVTLFAYLVSFLTRSGALVLDCFAGSGTTGVAAIQAGRRCLMIEHEADYCEIARARCRAAERARQPALFEEEP